MPLQRSMVFGPTGLIEASGAVLSDGDWGLK